MEQGVSPKKNIHKIFDHIPHYGLFVLWVVMTVLHYIWLKRCEHPPMGDGIVFILRGMNNAELWNAQGLWMLLKNVFSFNGLVGSLMDVIYTLYYGLFGITSEMELMIGTVFLGIGMLGVYKMTSRFLSKSSGLLAAIIFSSMIGIIMYIRQGGFREYYMTCLFLLTWYALEATNRFASRRYALLAGLLIAGCITIKYEAVIWLIVPVCYNVFFGDTSQGKQARFTKGHFGNFMLCLGSALLIIGVWYGLQYRRLGFNMLGRFGSNSIQDLGVSFEQPFFYVKAITRELMSSSVLAFAGLLLIYNIIQSLITRRWSHAWDSLIRITAYAIFPLILFSIIGCKFRVHVMPFLALISVFICNLYYLIKPRVLRYAFFLLFCIHACTLHFGALACLYQDQPRTNVFLKVSLLDRIGVELERRSIGTLLGETWNHEAGQGWDACLKGICRFIADDATRQPGQVADDARIRILVAVNNMPLRYFQLQYYNAKLRLPLTFIPVLYESTYWPEDGVQLLLYKRDINYILTEEKSWEESYDGENFGIGQIRHYISGKQEEFSAKFELIQTLNTSRDSTVNIYRNRLMSKK
jgi:hypothetical protein